jgi:hypothetical protein
MRLFTVEGVVAGWMVAGASVPGQVSRSSEDGGSYAAHLEDLDVPDATFGCPDLTTFCRPDELGLVVVGQRLEPDRAVLACRSWTPMTAPRAGADAAGVQEDPGTPSRGSWRTSPWAGDRPPFW